MSVKEEGVEITPRPLCSTCHRNLCEISYKKKNDVWVKSGFRSKCRTCSRGYSRHSSKAWAVHKKDYCENNECTATIESIVQLTVDHIDGNKKNNDPSNLMTLCANCHALKTFLNRDFLNLAYRV